jgi:hypothetical protein
VFVGIQNTTAMAASASGSEFCFPVQYRLIRREVKKSASPSSPSPSDSDLASGKLLTAFRSHAKYGSTCYLFVDTVEAALAALSVSAQPQAQEAKDAKETEKEEWSEPISDFGKKVLAFLRDFRWSETCAELQFVASLNSAQRKAPKLTAPSCTN